MSDGSEHQSVGAGAGTDAAADDLDGAAMEGSVGWMVQVVVAVAVVAGLVFRFVTRSPLWLDEALSVDIAALPPGEILEALRHDGHPPLYYLLLHAWSQVAGTGDVAVRSLSAVFSIGSLPLVWVAGRRRGGALLGWVALGVLAASPYAMRYGSEARMYSMVSFLVLVGYLLIDDVVRVGKDRPWRLGAIAVVTGVLLLTHYWALWLVAAVGLVCLWEWRRSTTLAARPRAGKVALALIGGGVLFAWWLPAMLYQSAHTGTPWALPNRPTVSASFVLVDFAAGTGFPDAPVIAVVSALLFALGLFGVSTRSDRIELLLKTNPQLRFEAVVLALTLAIGLGTAYLSRSAFAARYGAVFFPFFVLLVAAGITRFRDRRVQAAVLAAFVLLSGLGAVYNAFIFQRSQVREAADAIRAVAAPDDVVVFCPDQLGPSGARALGPGFRTMSYPDLDDPALVDWVDYADRNAKSDPVAIGNAVLERAGDDHAVFVVWSGSYRTLEHKCETLVQTISARRLVSKTLVDADGEKYYESAMVSWFGPAVPTAPAGGGS